MSLLNSLGELLSLPQDFLGESVLLLLVLLVVWVLRRLRSTGSGRGLPYLCKLVSLLSKDYGTLVGIIDDWYQASSRLEAKLSEAQNEVKLLQAELQAADLSQNINVEEDFDGSGEPEA